jgi:hypothetical protein
MMKTLKTILISVVITLLVASLVVSILCNNMILSLLEIKDAESFKQVLFCKEVVDSMQQLEDALDTDTTVPEDTEQQPTEDTETEDAPAVEAPEPEVNMPTDTIIYEDAYAKVTYVKQELSIFGPTVKFLVESKTTKTINISFNDVYIDGFMAESCSAYVSDLTEGKKSFETLYIYEYDYEDFTSFPSIIEFTIKVIDSESWDRLAESDVIYLEIEQQ